MKIKKIECEQFAGVQDRKIEFEDGLNIIVGKNESGKSTMIDLIYHLLFKDVKLDRRSDSNFIDQYFPKKANGPEGDVIDGVLNFETQNGEYKLFKEWEMGQGSCKLTTPEGTIIKSPEEITKILTKEMCYSEGVYNEVVFTSQKRQQLMIECILQEVDKKKKSDNNSLRADLTETITQAVMETGGVSLDKIEDNLKKTLEKFEARWDFSSDLPEGGVKRGIENKWRDATTKDADNGEQAIILRAYYDMKDIAKEQDQAENAEKNVEHCKKDISGVAVDKKATEDKRKEFQQVRSTLAQKNLLDESIEKDRKSLKDMNDAVENWPEIKSKLQKAYDLQSKQSQAKIRKLYEDVDKVQSELRENNDAINRIGEISEKDLNNTEAYEREKIKLEGKIAGLNLVAKIKTIGDIPVQVNSAVDRNNIDTSSGEIVITESIEIKVPGILEMQLMPKGIDLDVVMGKLNKINNEINEIYNKYEVLTLKELQKKSKEYNVIKGKIESLDNNKSSLLMEKSWEALQKEYIDIPSNLESKENIANYISDLCGVKTIDHFIGEFEAKKENYEEKYGSIDNLKESINGLSDKIIKEEKKLNSLDNIPDEYKKITDPDRYSNEIDREIEGFDEKLEEYRDNLRNAERKLSDKSAEEYAEDLANAKTDFDAKKAKYAHWKHIYDAFMQLKESAKGNPMKDVEENFRKYLATISDGEVSLTSVNEQLTAKLTSGNHVLTNETLSEGTKDTISLAFRLAMLDHLYPEGGGLAVFDDPFTDMDEMRTVQSCRLIQKYAENNQVIFITCDSKYQSMLAGNIISMSNI